MGGPQALQRAQERALALLEFEFARVAVAENVQCGQSCTVDQSSFSVGADAVGAFDRPDRAERMGAGPDGDGCSWQDAEGLREADYAFGTEQDAASCVSSY
ncbi:conserved hypothetical protein [Streptomyces sviceus ATCC 29083]|uniref:Uncharacterized protein n=1 Tax=Streptomyces sviceus (strain ATCC 29083 / DSM 924 / JCM 4929 / NBRC 13980 / NCIMB 11184 / NRRL 5439 / UC 5370) TaxID=463191 RepID=B5I8C7_STRX2|nr:conserved hypothetical protein [Streptomyces sviceus ATCC 29083]